MSSFRTTIVFCLALALLVGLCAIDGRSFWIDEAGTAVLVSAPSFGSLLDRMFHEGGSTSQMPLHVMYAWLWRKAGGDSEYWLRLSNLPWFMLGVAAILGCWRRRHAVFMMAAICTSGLLWYYLNEFRPYIMQWAGAAMVAGSLSRRFRAHLGENVPLSGVEAWLLGCGFVVLAGSSMLGAIWCVGGVLAWFTVAPSKWYRCGGVTFRAAIAVTGCLLCALAFYYVLTIGIGARGTMGGKTGLKEIAFVAYEMLGLTGMGPGRIDLRATAGAALRDVRYLAPVVSLAVFVVCAMGAGLLKAFRTDRKRLLVFWALALSPCLLLVLIGVFMHFRILSRHFMPAALAAAALLASGMTRLWSSRRVHQRVAMCLLLGCLVWSCVQIRLAPRHVKDDYRAAARIAGSAAESGRTVWWAASSNGALFYGIRFGEVRMGTGGRVLRMTNPSWEALLNSDVPDTIVMSKTDLFDKAGVLRRYVRENGFSVVSSLPAFTIWE